MATVSRIVAVQVTAAIPPRTLARWAQSEAEWYHRKLNPVWPEMLHSSYALFLQQRRAHHAREARRLMGVE